MRTVPFILLGAMAATLVAGCPSKEDKAVACASAATTCQNNCASKTGQAGVDCLKKCQDDLTACSSKI